MRKLLGFLLTVLVSFVAGFWVSENDVIQGTKAGEVIQNVVDRIPVPELSTIDSSVVETSDLTTEAFRKKLEEQTEDSEATAKNLNGQTSDINQTTVEKHIFTLLNELRTEQGVPVLVYNDTLKAAADTRARETEELFSHTRPDGSEAFTVLNEPDHQYDYRTAGENLAMATFFKSEKEMAELLFDGWVESEGHYENMIAPEFKEVGIGVHYDGEHLYATQLFGTPF